MTKNIYFKNFDSIRAIAAMLVLVAHIELHKPEHGLNRFQSIDLIPLGTISVTLFFVLSGFLITYLLISELFINKKVNVKFFYVRRVLKIWPLYFLVLLAGVFIYKFSAPISKWVLAVFFLPNVAYTRYGLPSLIDPIWSIGIEEQFYLLFPLLFLLKDLKKIFQVIFVLCFLLLALRFFAIYMHLDSLKEYLYLARFDCMLIGSLGAFAFHFYKTGNPFFTKLIKVVYTWQVQVLSFGLMIIYLSAGILFKTLIIHQVLAFLFVIILINMGTNPASKINIENKVLNKIGVISYGVYLTHKFTNYIVLQYCHFENIYLENILIYTCSILLSAICAHLLYYNYEIHFINLKKKFSFFIKK